MMRVLVVDDDDEFVRVLSRGLHADGFEVATAGDGMTAIRIATERDFDVMLLDRDMPGMDGDGVCRVLRTAGLDVGIIMVTAAGSLSDRVKGLDVGADDYLPKPFAYIELLSRIRAVGRRARSTLEQVLTTSDITLDTTRRVAERAGRRLSLAPKELGVLEVLLIADGGYLSTSELLDQAWERGDEVGSSVVKVTVHGLRRKLGDPPILFSSPGLGYRLG